MRITIYPGAHHSFDSYAPVRYVAARINANREVVAFFAEYLE